MVALVENSKIAGMTVSPKRQTLEKKETNMHLAKIFSDQLHPLEQNSRAPGHSPGQFTLDTLF